MKICQSQKLFIGLLVVALGLAACAKKKEAAPAPSVPALETAAPSNFQMPPIVKKQAKYFPEGTPSRAIQDLDDMLDSYIINPQTPADKQYNAELKKKVLHGTFDIRELSRLALAEHWDQRSPQERDYFVDLMIKLLEKKAVFSKEQGQKKSKTKAVYKVTYEGDSYLNPDKTQALAKSLVHIPSENLQIGLDYKLKKGDAQWVIYDVVVDGASLLDNYKYQFDKIIAKDGYPTLVHRMESKLKDLEAKEPA